jgi:branched-chain amino acid transport system permease protein
VLVVGDDPDPGVLARGDFAEYTHTAITRPGVSLGHRGLHGVGAYGCLQAHGDFPGINIVVHIALSGFFAAGVGVLFGLPSLRIKGFYLAVATLAAQFFLSWFFIRVPWIYNYNVSGAIEVPTRTFFGVVITGPNATPMARYYVVLGFVVVMTWLAPISCMDASGGCGWLFAIWISPPN